MRLAGWECSVRATPGKIKPSLGKIILIQNASFWLDACHGNDGLYGIASDWISIGDWLRYRMVFNFAVPFWSRLTRTFCSSLHVRCRSFPKPDWLRASGVGPPTRGGVLDVSVGGSRCIHVQVSKKRKPFNLWGKKKLRKLLFRLL